MGSAHGPAPSFGHLLLACRSAGDPSASQDQAGGLLDWSGNLLIVKRDRPAVTFFHRRDHASRPVNIVFRRAEDMADRFDLRRMDQQLSAEAKIACGQRVCRYRLQVVEIRRYAVYRRWLSGKAGLQHNL